jgi:hypothetical protein
MALAADRKLRITASGGTRNRRGLVNGGSTIYKGAALVVDAEGYLRPAVNTTGFQFVGWADEAVNNSAGDDGDVYCRYVTAATVEMDNDGTYPIAQSDLYKPCYISDDQTVKSAVGNGVIAGIAEAITAGGKIEVYGSPELATLAPSGEASLLKLFVLTDVDAKGTNEVHALYDGTDATTTTGFTNPDVPRNLRVVKASTWDGGTLSVTGTDQYDDPVTESFPATGAGTEVGVKIFKTVTSFTKGTPAGVTGAGVSIGTGDKLGIVGNIDTAIGTLRVGTTAEAVTVDATYDAFTPTTVPDGAVDYTFATNIVVETD